MISDINIAGIPAQVVWDVYYDKNGYIEPGGRRLEPEEKIIIDVDKFLDRKGYRAKWLEKKVEKDDTVFLKFCDEMFEIYFDVFPDPFARPVLEANFGGKI